MWDGGISTSFIACWNLFTIVSLKFTKQFTLADSSVFLNMRNFADGGFVSIKSPILLFDCIITRNSIFRVVPCEAAALLSKVIYLN